jgi:phage terminase Nu1 subunit (DNA packaging protein)
LVEREGLEDLWEQINRRQVAKQSPNTVDADTTPQPATHQPRRRQPATTSAPGGEDVPDYNDERALHEREKRMLAQLARQEKEGELLRREDVDQAWGRAVNLTRTKLLGVPSVAKQRIPHLDVEEVEILMGLIREALEELATGQEAA